MSRILGWIQHLPSAKWGTFLLSKAYSIRGILLILQQWVTGSNRLLIMKHCHSIWKIIIPVSKLQWHYKQREMTAGMLKCMKNSFFPLQPLILRFICSVVLAVAESWKKNLCHHLVTVSLCLMLNSHVGWDHLVQFPIWVRKQPNPCMITCPEILH